MRVIWKPVFALGHSYPFGFGICTYPKRCPNIALKKQHTSGEFSKLTSNRGPKYWALRNFRSALQTQPLKLEKFQSTFQFFRSWGNPQTQLPSPKKIGSTADRGENVQAHPLAWRSFQPRPPKCWGKLPIQPKTVETWFNSTISKPNPRTAPNATPK